jgi:hypothetical protein
MAGYNLGIYLIHYIDPGISIMDNVMLTAPVLTLLLFNPDIV